MKEYDLISIGTGSAMGIVEAMIQENPKIKDSEWSILLSLP